MVTASIALISFALGILVTAGYFWFMDRPDNEEHHGPEWDWRIIDGFFYEASELQDPAEAILAEIRGEA